MKSWKKKFKNDFSAALEQDAPKVDSLEQTEPAKKKSFWPKVLIPLGASAVLALSIALPLSLNRGARVGDVFLKAGEAMSRKIDENDSTSQTKLSLREPYHESDQGVLVFESAFVVYTVGLLLNNGYDVLHQTMDFYLPYKYTFNGESYSHDFGMTITADINHDENRLIFYTVKRYREVHDPTNSAPFSDEFDFISDVDYNEKTDEIYAFTFNLPFFFGHDSSKKLHNTFFECDQTGFWKTDDTEESPINTRYQAYFATFAERKKNVIEAKGGGRLLMEAENHISQLHNGEFGYLEIIE